MLYDAFLPQTIIETDDDVFVRLKNSIFSIKLKDHLIRIDENDNIRLVTVASEDGEKYKFWHINNEVCKLYEDVRVKIDENSMAFKYFKDVDADGNEIVYVMFSNSECLSEVVCFSKRNLNVVIYDRTSHYKHMQYRDGVFYAHDGSSDFAIIVNDNSTNIYEVGPCACFIVKGFEKVTYGLNIIKFGNTKKVINDFYITKVEVIKNYSCIILKVISDKGNYYYDEHLNLLFGPIKNETIEKNDYESSVYVYVHDENGNINKVYYINIDAENRKYSIRLIESTICIERCLSNKNKENRLLVCRHKGEISIYNMNLDLIVSDVSRYIISSRNKFIVYQDTSNKFYLVEYDKNFLNNTDLEKVPIEYIREGIETPKEGITKFNNNEKDSAQKESSYVFKSKHNIFCINDSGKVIFDVPGRNCKIKKFGSDLVYIVDDVKEIRIFTKYGISLTPR